MLGPYIWNGERMVRIGELNYMAERRGEDAVYSTASQTICNFYSETDWVLLV